MLPKNWMNFAKKHKLLTAVSAIGTSLVLIVSVMFFIQNGVTAVTTTTTPTATTPVTITTTNTMAGLTKAVSINGLSTTVAVPVPTETATPSPTTTTTPVPTQQTPTPISTPTSALTPTFTPTTTPGLVAAQTISPTSVPTSLVANQTSSPATPANQQTDQKIKDLEAQVKKLKEQQARQERKISWLESVLNSLWKIFGFIFGGTTAPPEFTPTPTSTFTPTSTPTDMPTSVATSTPTTPAPTPIPTTTTTPTTTPIIITVTPTETPTVTTTPDNVLFYDDFSGDFPGKNWIYTGGGGTPQADSSTGNPVPSLLMPGPKLVPRPTSMGEGGPMMVGSGQGSLIELRSATNPFNTVAGFEISADVSTESKSSFTFSIINQNENRIYASAMPTKGYVTYEIRTGYNTGRSTKNPVMTDSDFHKLTFKVDADGNAKWLRDDVLQFSQSGFPAGDYVILFKTSGGTTYDEQLATAGVYIDNVKTTSLMQTASPKATSTSSTTTGGGGGGGTTSTIGTLSVSDDNGNLYVGGSYIGRGSAVVSLYAGSYTLSDYSPSTGDLCWQRSIRIDGGRTTLVKIDTYCR